MNKTFSTILLFSLLFSPIYSQSRRETKAYRSALKKGDIVSFDKFLKKYPSSTYAASVTFKIDSILYYQLDGNTEAYLNYINERPQSSFSSEAISIVKQRCYSSHHTYNDDLINTCVADSIVDLSLGGRNYWFYTQYNYLDSLSASTEYSANLFDLQNGVIYSALFSGKKIKTDNSKGYYIEGESMDKNTNALAPTAEMTYLLNLIDTTSFLIPISQADLLTDQAVEWWYGHNKKGARKLSFGSLPAESSLVKHYQESKWKESSKSYNAAIVDIRDNTVICVYQKNAGQYILVWCEPMKNESGKVLNSIYFENASSLVLFYYQGKKSLKTRINLSTRLLD